MKSCYDTIIYRKYVYRLLFDKRQLCAHPDGVRKDKKVCSIHVNYLSYNTLCPLLRWTVQPISIVRAGVLNYAINLWLTCMPNNVVGSIRWTDPWHSVTSLTYQTSLHSLGELLTSDCTSGDPSLTWPLPAAVSKATWTLLTREPQITALSKKLFSHKTLTLAVSKTIRFNGSSLGIPLTSFLHS